MAFAELLVTAMDGWPVEIDLKSAVQPPISIQAPDALPVDGEVRSGGSGFSMQELRDRKLECTSIYVVSTSYPVSKGTMAKEPMTYEEFHRQLGKAGLSIRAFAKLVRMNPNSVSNYAGIGKVPTHLAVIAVLMGEMAEKGIDFRNALARLPVAAKKPRGGSRKGRFGGDRQSDLNFPQ
jgi:hypothetical protein